MTSLFVIISKIRSLLCFLSRSDRGANYVNGPDTLPPPLSAEQEIQILSKLGKSPTDDRKIRSLLVERNLRLVVYISKKFENTHVGMEDLISIGTIGRM